MDSSAFVTQDIKQDTTSDVQKAKMYWKQFTADWETYKSRILNAEQYQLRNLKDYDIRTIILNNMNKTLNKFFPDIKLSYTFGECNAKSAEEYKDLIEVYFSTQMYREHISTINIIYKHRPKLDGLFVTKFGMMQMPITGIMLSKNINTASKNISNASKNISTVDKNNKLVSEEKEIIGTIMDEEYTYKLLFDPDKEHNNEDEEHKEKTRDDMTDDSLIVTLDDIYYKGQIGLSENKETIMHIILYLKGDFKKMMTKKKVHFEGEKGPSTREVWMVANRALDIIMENLIGEENLTLYIGYIEIIPEFNEAELLKQDDFNNITQLLSEIELLKLHVVKCCVCGHNNNQCQIYKCAKCNKMYYCSRICQRLDYKNHKTICNISATTEHKSTEITADT
jgi:hypothetical protein